MIKSHLLYQLSYGVICGYKSNAFYRTDKSFCGFLFFFEVNFFCFSRCAVKARNRLVGSVGCDGSELLSIGQVSGVAESRVDVEGGGEAVVESRSP